jgi:hypothetical protein
MDKRSEMMQRETSFFLQVLADYLNGRVTKVPENLEWEILEKVGQAQQLTGIIYHQCKNSIAQSSLPEKSKMKWKLSYVYNSFQYSKRLALLKQIGKEFQKEGIPYLIFKGTEVAKFYPVPAQRTMGDIDLLVHEEDKQKACDVLCRLGFEVNTGSPIEWFASKGDMKIELHHRLIYAHSFELKIIQAWGDKVWDNTVFQNDTVQGKLDLTYHLVYVLLHLRKHMLEQGVGFRQFMDVAVLALQPGINWKQAEFWFRELDLIKFSQVCFDFCQRWFDIQIPVGVFKLTEDFYNESTDKILAGGVFGANDEEYKENAVFNEVHFAKSSSTTGFLKWAFLPYEEMRARYYCKFLNGRPYLLPVAWCWRLVYRIYTGNLVPLLKGAFANETIKKKEGRLSKWGL